MPPTIEAESLSHWTAREVPNSLSPGYMVITLASFLPKQTKHFRAFKPVQALFQMPSSSPL